MPGDQTTLRDNMLARMEMATPGGPSWPYVPQREAFSFPTIERLEAIPDKEPERKPDPLHSFDEAQTYALGREAYQSIFKAPLPSPSRLSIDLTGKTEEIRRALDQGKRVILTADNEELAIFEPTSGAVLAACLRNEFASYGRVTAEMLDAAQSFLPDVDREALRLTIEAALTQEKTL